MEKKVKKRRLFDGLMEAVEDIDQWKAGQDHLEDLHDRIKEDAGSHPGDHKGYTGKIESLPSGICP